MARSLKGIFSMENIGMALGGATSGFIKGMLPIPDFGIVGVSEMLIGAGGMMFLGKRGILKAYFKGVFIAGLSNAIASFIPQFAGTFPSAKQAPEYPNSMHRRVGQHPRTGLYVTRSPGFEAFATEHTFYPKQQWPTATKATTGLNVHH